MDNRVSRSADRRGRSTVRPAIIPGSQWVYLLHLDSIPAGGLENWRDGSIPALVRFIKRLGEEKLKSFSTYDFLALDYLRREQALPDYLKACLPGLVTAGAVESIGRGRGARYVLSRGLYAALGSKGVYTRQKGLDRGTNKALLLKHIQDNALTGAQMEEFRQVLPALARSQIQVLLRELRKEQTIHSVGLTNGARWFPVPASANCNSDEASS